MAVKILDPDESPFEPYLSLCPEEEEADLHLLALSLTSHFLGLHHIGLYSCSLLKLFPKGNIR